MKIVLGILIGSKDAPENAPAWLLKAVQSVQVEQGDGSGTGDWQQGFQMTFRAERSQADSKDYALLSSPLLNAGNRIILTITLDARPHVLFDGIIAHRQLSPGSAASAPSLTVMGKDLSILMDLEEKDVDLTGLGDKEVVDKILRGYAGYGVVAKTSAPTKTWTPNEKERAPKQVATDRQYVQMLAERHSFIFHIKPGPSPKQSTGYWGPLEYDGTPQKALTVNSGAATNVESFNVADDALKPTVVFGTVRKDNAAQVTPIDIAQSSFKTTLAKNSRLTSDPSFVRKLRLIYSGVSVAEAQAMAQSMTDRSTEQVLRVSGSLDTFRYGSLLKAPGIVGVRGAGYSYDGNYYVRQVTHRITRGEYKQDFVLTREGPGSKTQTVRTS
jgi:hypothetical protein